MKPDLIFPLPLISDLLRCGMKNRCFALLVAMVALACDPARAAFVYTFTQIGPDVHLSGAGTFDFSDLGLFSTGVSHGVYTNPTHGIVASGQNGIIVNQYSGITGPTNFGAGAANILATSTTGNFLYIGAITHSIAVADTYWATTPIANSAIYAGQSFASMGLTVGTYVFTWGEGEHADSLTVNVSDAVPEPSTWALLGLGVLTLGWTARRRRISQS